MSTGHRNRRQPRLRQLGELRVTLDESREMPRAIFDGGEDRMSCSGSGGALARIWPEWASEEIGARELFSSWAITRITFFQVATSCELISRVSCLSISRRCGTALSRKLRCET